MQFRLALTSGGFRIVSDTLVLHESIIFIREDRHQNDFDISAPVTFSLTFWPQQKDGQTGGV